MNSRSGFLTVEFLIALAVFTTVGVVAARSVFEVQDIGAALSGYSEALDITAVDGQVITAHTSSFQSLPEVMSAQAPFALSRELVPLSPCSELGKDQVAWQGFRPHSITLDTTVEDVQAPVDLGLDCAATGLAGIWQAIAAQSNINLHTRVQMHGVDVVTRNGKRIAVVVGSSTNAADPDIFIVDVTNLSSPQLLGQLHTGAGIFAVDVAGQFAYAVQNNTTGQLQVINIANPANLSVTASGTLPGVTGSFPQGRSVFYFRGRVYVGTDETAGAELHVFDVSSAGSATWLGSRAVNHSIRHIIVREELVNGVQRLLAYLASSGNSAEVLVLDVTTPTSITELSQVDLPGVGSSTALFAADTRLLVARQQGAGEQAVWSVDIANPTAPVLLAGSSINLRSGSVVNGLTVSNGLALFTTTDTAAPLIRCSIDAQFVLSSCNRFTLFTDPGRVDMQDGVVFAANNHGLTIISGQ